MKQSFKTLGIVAVAGVGIYTAFIVGLRIMHIVSPRPYHFDLMRDIFIRGMFDLLLVSIALAAIAMMSRRPLPNATKQFRIFTYVLAALLVLTFISAPLTSVRCFLWSNAVLAAIRMESVALNAGYSLALDDFEATGDRTDTTCVSGRITMRHRHFSNPYRLRNCIRHFFALQWSHTSSPLVGH